jgi:ferric-dicitrate binding protein FerR (iron transport regulator)
MNDHSTYYTDLITRYFSGETTEEELRLLSDWLKADQQNEELFTQFRKTWQLVEKQKIISRIDIDHEWKTMQAKIHSDVLPDDFHTKVLQLTRKKSRISSYRSFWLAAAAVVVLFISTVQLYNFFSKPSNITIIAQTSNIERVLPDGSVISLHAGSQITYPEKFTSGTRKVELKGEAYFKVSHDKKMPFIVSSGAARIEVLGTQFNVNTKTSAGIMEVVLTTGKVSVYYKANPKENVLLDPGEKAVLNTDQNLISKSTNTDPNYMAWKTRVLEFDNETLAQVVNTLQNVYQTPVTLADPALAGCRVTASFNDQSLESVLQVIKETLDLQVKQNGKTIEISGKSCR